MIDASTIAAAMGAPCMVSGDMQQKMQLWEDIYENKAAWHSKRVRPMRIPGAIARELKRLTLTEFTASVSDTEIDDRLQETIPAIRRQLDMGLAMGGLLLKPYFAGSVLVDIVPQNAYLPQHVRQRDLPGRDRNRQNLLYPSGTAYIRPDGAHPHHCTALLQIRDAGRVGGRVQPV